MEKITVDSICAVTEGSNASFPQMKLAIRTFIKYNKWFDGEIIILTLSSNPLSSYNINIINQEYRKIKIIIIDDSNLEKLDDNDKLDYLKIHAFNIDAYGVLYFTRSTLFINGIEDILNDNHISSYEIGTNSMHVGFELEHPNYNFMYIPSKFLSKNSKLYSDLINLKPSKFTNNKLIEFFKQYNIPIIKDALIVNASNYTDGKYSTFIRYHKAFGAIIMNSVGSMYKRINMFWLGVNTKESKIQSPSQLNIEDIPISKDINELEYNVSIIIPAYKAELYIEECVKSIMNQTFKSNIEILIGIDGCESTLNTVNKIKEKYNLRVFYNDSVSVGPYIIKNSLISKAKYNNLLFFDADDIMLPNLISNVIKYYNKNSPIRFKYYNFTDGSDYIINKSEHHDVAHGVFFSPKSILDKIGGFQPWLCGADTEFMKRCRINKFNDIKLQDCLFYRRIHGNSLTQNKETNHRSKVREEARLYINNNKNWSIPIFRTTINLIEL